MTSSLSRTINYSYKFCWWCSKSSLMVRNVFPSNNIDFRKLSHCFQDEYQSSKIYFYYYWRVRTFSFKIGGFKIQCLTWTFRCDVSWSSFYSSKFETAGLLINFVLELIFWQFTPCTFRKKFHASSFHGISEFCERWILLREHYHISIFTCQK